MAFHVRDPETDILVRELALVRGVGLTEAVKQAVATELQRVRTTAAARRAGMQVVIDEIARQPDVGPHPDKAFFDELSGDGDNG